MVNNNIHEKAAIGFDRAGDSYERGRPEYPPEAISFLVNTLQIDAASNVLDLGSGTGKFTKLLVPSGAKVVAVEPVEGMRAKFQSLLPTIKLLNGSAENIPTGDCSVDVVIAAQAFHWFDTPAALREIHRVLKPNGKLGLIWNARDESLDWVGELTKIIDPHEGGAPRYKSMRWQNAFTDTNLFSKIQLQQFVYTQVGTIETIVDRIGSISFISALPELQKKVVLDQVRRLVHSHPDTRDKTEVKLPYRTDVFWCQKI
ncbi:MAG: class I SAM-dependent methyltransferase [Bdellovibrionaceae bacterium]|nr:class I SAM-dependent methyltransferase [Pseudobdellovibrionaceae bacterium]